MHKNRLWEGVRERGVSICRNMSRKPVFRYYSLWHIFINHNDKQHNMKKQPPGEIKNKQVKKGYNEKNPGQSQGAFPPASDNQSKKDDNKSNAVDRKRKEESR
jgi:hypothetical protein